MTEIFVQNNASLAIKEGGKLKAIKSFTATINDCDCGIECCGDKQVIRWVTPDKKLRTVSLDAIFALVSSEGKTETQL